MRPVGGRERCLLGPKQPWSAGPGQPCRRQFSGHGCAQVGGLRKRSDIIECFVPMGLTAVIVGVLYICHKFCCKFLGNYYFSWLFKLNIFNCILSHVPFKEMICCITRQERSSNSSRVWAHLRSTYQRQHMLLGLERRWPVGDKGHEKCWCCRRANGRKPAFHRSWDR
jgi:hypothetical protein